MGLEHPASLGWALLAVLLIGLYFWPFRRQRVEVATLVLWERALARRPAWLALQFYLSLATQIVILLLLVLALAQPFLTGLLGSRRTLVLVLDVSASMSARDVPPSRFERMRGQARELIDGLSRSDRMGIITAGTLVEPVCRLGASRQRLRAACDALVPSDGVSHVAAAVEMARRMLHDQPNPQIIVISDGGFTEAAALAEAGDVQLLLIAGQPDNAGITALATRPIDTSSGRVAVLAEVINGGQQPIDRRLEIGISGRPAETFPLQLPPGAAVHRQVTIDVSGDAVLRAALQEEDHLAADNVVSQPIAAGSPQRVRLIAQESDAGRVVEAALRDAPGIELEVAEFWQPSSAPVALHVFLCQVPAELPPGPVLVLEPQAASDLWQVAGSREGSFSVQPTGAHPHLLSRVRLDEVVVERLVQLQFHSPAEAIAISLGAEVQEQANVYSLLPRREGPVLVWLAAVDREHSDLLLREDFSQLIRNAIRWLLPPAATREAAVTTGEVLRLPSGRSAQLAKPAAHPAAETAVTAPLAVLDRIGEWQVTPAAPQDDASAPTRIHVNLLDAAESTLSGSPAGSAQLPAVASRWDQPLWLLLVAAAVILLALDGVLFHRKMLV